MSKKREAELEVKVAELQAVVAELQAENERLHEQLAARDRTNQTFANGGRKLERQQLAAKARQEEEAWTPAVVSEASLRFCTWARRPRLAAAIVAQTKALTCKTLKKAGHKIGDNRFNERWRTTWRNWAKDGPAWLHRASPVVDRRSEINRLNYLLEM